MTTPRNPRVVLVGAHCPLGRCFSIEFSLKKGKLMIIPGNGIANPLDCTYMKDLGATEIVVDSSSPQNYEDWSRIMEKTRNLWGGIDFLLYFDTVYHENTFSEATEIETIKTITHINFTAPIGALQAAIPFLENSKGQVAFVMAPAVKAGTGTPGTALYTASKRALEAYVTSVHQSGPRFGITCIYPGEIIENGLYKAKQLIISERLKGSIMDALIYKEFQCSLATRGRSNTIKQIRGEIYANGIPELEPPPIMKKAIESTSKLTNIVLAGNRVAFKEIMKQGKPQAMESILEKDENGRCALHFACYMGNWEFVSAMLRLGKKQLISERDSFDWTPLHFSAYGGHLRLTKKLLQESADPNALTLSKNSCLHFLARLNPGDDPKIISRYQAAIKKLIQLGADVNQRNANWVSPVHEAATNRSVVALSLFLQNEGDVHRKTRITKETPLQYAMKPHNTTVIKMLLEAGADPVGCFDTAPKEILPRLEKYREKNRRPDPDFEIEEKPPIYVSTVEELTPDAQKLFARSGLEGRIEDVYKHWDVFLLVLRFLSHKRFKNAKKRRSSRRSSVAYHGRDLASVKSSRKSSFASQGNLFESPMNSCSVESPDTPTRQRRKKKQKKKGKEESKQTKEETKQIKEEKEQTKDESKKTKEENSAEMFELIEQLMGQDNARNNSASDSGNEKKSEIPEAEETRSHGKPEETPTTDGEQRAEKEKHPRVVGSKANHEWNLEDAMTELISNGNPVRLFKVMDQVGRGGFGTVFRSKRMDTREIVAIKKVSFLTDKEKWNTLDEIYFLQSLKHPCIVSYLASYIYRDEVWITMDFLAGGSLHDVVKLNRFEEQHICFVVKQMLKGLRFMHSKGVVHRDLKSANVMLGITGDVYLIDFGLCCSTSYYKRGIVGSPFWIPPEMMHNESTTQASDIWSLGIICLEMADGAPPNYNSALAAMFTVAIGEVPTFSNSSKSWSPEFHAFMKRIMVVDPKQRATASELLKDPWIKFAECKKGMKVLFQHIFVEKSLESLLV